jgi:hypothetical protein
VQARAEQPSQTRAKKQRGRAVSFWRGLETGEWRLAFPISRNEATQSLGLLFLFRRNIKVI